MTPSHERSVRTANDHSGERGAANDESKSPHSSFLGFRGIVYILRTHGVASGSEAEEAFFRAHSYLKGFLSLIASKLEKVDAELRIGAKDIIDVASHLPLLGPFQESSISNHEEPNLPALVRDVLRIALISASDVETEIAQKTEDWLTSTGKWARPGRELKKDTWHLNFVTGLFEISSNGGELEVVPKLRITSPTIELLKPERSDGNARDDSSIQSSFDADVFTTHMNLSAAQDRGVKAALDRLVSKQAVEKIERNPCFFEIHTK